MTTYCSKCGSSLAVTDQFCPRCGTATSSYYANSGASSYEPTSLVAPSTTPSQTPTPPTNYGSNPYDVTLQNPYEPYNPYQAPPPLPSPPSPSRRPKLVLLIGTLVLVLIIVSVSAVVVLTQQLKNASTGNTSSSTATTIPTIGNAEKNPYPPNTGTQVLDDPLTDNSRGYGWDGGTLSDGSSCTFTGSAYQANQTNPQYVHPCFAHSTNFSNMAYEIKMTILKGDCGGLIFRADSANSKYYVFDVCQDGTFSLFYFSGFGQSGTFLISPGNGSSINTGLNHSNLLAIVANNSGYYLFVNGIQVSNAADSSFNHGAIGVIADPYYRHPTQVVFSNAKVWALP